jgi:hypothetical protein
LDAVRRLLGWTASADARKVRAGKIPLRDLTAGEFVLFNSYIMCGLVPPISSFFLLLLEEFGLQLHHLTPHSVLLAAVFAHFMEMFVGVRPCTTIFKHFYSLVGTGKKRGEIGAYYFQLRHGMAGSYIAAFSSSKWEDWREGWVIAAVEPHDRLELPTEGPQSDRSTWKSRPTIPAELDPVLYRIKKLARSGLTSMMVLGDFLKRRIAPLQQRSRMAYVYTGLNDCCRIARGPGGDFTRAELEAAIRAMTGEVFVPESLVLPSGVKALCEDQALRSSVLASMPTLDEGGLAVRQLRGDPNRGLQIPGAMPDRQQRTNDGSGGPGSRGPAPHGKGKERRRCRCQSTGRRTTRVLPRQKDAKRLKGRHPRGAAKSRGANPGGFSGAMAPWSGSRRPSARSRRGWRSRAELHHLHHNTGLPRDNRLLRHHHQNGGQRHHHHRPRPGHSPHRRHQKLRWSGTPIKSSGGPRQGGKSPQPPGADGSGATSRK